MKTQNEKKNPHLQLILKLILGAAIGFFLGFGGVKMVKAHFKSTSAIEQTIKDNCNCESVSKEHAFVGIQFSKEDGFTEQKASYILKNCEYEGSATQETQRLNEHLQVSVENYESLDLIELSFQSNYKNELVKIKHGKIL